MDKVEVVPKLGWPQVNHKANLEDSQCQLARRPLPETHHQRAGDLFRHYVVMPQLGWGVARAPCHSWHQKKTAGKHLKH